MDPRSSESLLDAPGLLTNYVARRLRYYEAIGELQPAIAGCGRWPIASSIASGAVGRSPCYRIAMPKRHAC